MCRRARCRGAWMLSRDLIPYLQQDTLILQEAWTQRPVISHTDQDHTALGTPTGTTSATLLLEHSQNETTLASFHCFASWLGSAAGS